LHRSVIVVGMTDEEATADKDRKLRLLESAAASAILNGATPEEARRRVEIGIAESLQNPIVVEREKRRLAAASA
jgi:hypothetical protein